jgi:thioredoxin 1
MNTDSSNGKIITLNDESFNKLLEDFNGVAMIDFTASWCGPCQQMKPVYEKLSSDQDLNEVSFYSLDVDQNPLTTQKFGVTAMPTLILVKIDSGQKKIEVLEVIRGFTNNLLSLKTKILDKIK